MSEPEITSREIFPSPEWFPVHREMLLPNAAPRETLQRNPLFENLSRRDWRELTDLFHERQFQAGETIFLQGTPGLGMYIIVSGAVRIIRVADDRQLELARLIEGDFFGEMSLVDDFERSATALVAEPTQLIAIFRPQLEALMNRRPALGIILMRRLARIISFRLREANGVLSESSQPRSTLSSR